MSATSARATVVIAVLVHAYTATAQTSRPAIEERLDKAASLVATSPDAAEAQFKQIIDDLEAATTRDPNDAERWALLGRTRAYRAHFTRDKANFDPAIAAVKRAIDLKPNEPAYWQELAWVLESADKLEEALDACRHVVQLDPKSSTAQATMGGLLAQLGRDDEAVVMLR